MPKTSAIQVHWILRREEKRREEKRREKRREDEREEKRREEKRREVEEKEKRLRREGDLRKQVSGEGSGTKPGLADTSVASHGVYAVSIGTNSLNLALINI